MIPLEITHDDLTFSQESQEDGRRLSGKGQSRHHFHIAV
jgi:hypothetical protein